MELCVTAPWRVCGAKKQSPKWNWKKGRVSRVVEGRWWEKRSGKGFSGGARVRASACPFSPIDEPILKEALKEPVAFIGGMFAGLLRLDLNEDPLKEWVTRTVGASGITEEDIDPEWSKSDQEAPQQIEIE